MKRTTTGLIALALTAAVSLSACGGSTNVSAATVSEKPADTQNATLQAETSAAQTETSALQAETLDASVSTDSFEDAFSSRDLAGTWDAASAISITLNGTSISCNSGAVAVSGSVATITAAGTYRVTGTLSNGSLIVDAGQDDKVQIVLDNASIHSETFAAIYVKQADKVFLTLADGTENALSNGGTFESVDENNVDGAVFSKDDLTLNGSGKLVVNSPAKHGVVCKDDLTITGGTYEITAASHAISAKDGIGVAGGVFTLKAGKDGIQAKNEDDSAKGNVYLAGGTFTITVGDDGVTASATLQMDGGTLDVTASEGLEGNYIRINDGVIRVQASDDGITAARKSGGMTPAVEINGGDISVTVGQGDTDCIDSNGNLIITGGTVSVTGNSGFDVDGSVTFTGGTVIINGQQVDTIPTQMFGGRGGRGGFGANGGMNGRGAFGAPNGNASGDTNGNTSGNASGDTNGNVNGNVRGKMNRGTRQFNGSQTNELPDATAGATRTPGKNQGGQGRVKTPSNTEGSAPALPTPDNAAFI